MSEAYFWLNTILLIYIFARSFLIVRRHIADKNIHISKRHCNEHTLVIISHILLVSFVIATMFFGISDALLDLSTLWSTVLITFIVASFDLMLQHLEDERIGKFEKGEL